jgi:hypothetical protein
MEGMRRKRVWFNRGSEKDWPARGVRPMGEWGRGSNPGTSEERAIPTQHAGREWNIEKENDGVSETERGGERRA